MKNKDVEAKVQWIGMIITQLEHDNTILNALVHQDTPPKKFVERKSTMEKTSRKVTEVTTQF